MLFVLLLRTRYLLVSFHVTYAKWSTKSLWKKITFNVSVIMYFVEKTKQQQQIIVFQLSPTKFLNCVSIVAVLSPFPFFCIDVPMQSQLNKPKKNKKAISSYKCKFKKWKNKMGNSNVQKCMRFWYLLFSLSILDTL